MLNIFTRPKLSSFASRFVLTGFFVATWANAQTASAPPAKPAAATTAAKPAATGGNAFEQITRDFLHDLIEISKMSKENKGTKSNETNVLIKKCSERVDFTSLARKSLGARWPKLPAAERKDFLITLQQLLEEVAYPKASKLAVSEDQLKFVYSEQTEPRVKVNGEMEREKRGEMVLEKVEIQIIFDKKTKKVVDAVVENENVSQNLKRQFDEAFKTRTFAQIIEKMKRRISRAQGKVVPDEVDDKPTGKPAAKSPAKKTAAPKGA